MMHRIFVRGEISNCKEHSSGHIYFTLKDAKGVIQCVMFAGNRGGLRFSLREGQQVVVGGTIDIYERDGKYQLYAKEIVLDGAGALNEKFERLKRELEERGMFDSIYKRPIPKLNKTIGVVTAPTGAAVRDIIHIAKRRNPYVQIVLYPAIVQGDSAAFSVVNGIRACEEQNVDVIIVGRGGGSMEDLWAFNEEIVAEAIFNCSVPVISAVGHETDFTIADFVADLRAPTPSAAAELAVLDIREVLASIERMERSLQNGIWKAIRYERARLESYEERLNKRSPEAKIRMQRTELMYLEERLLHGMEQKLLMKRHQFEKLRLQMIGLSPLQKLNQGYAYVSNTDGQTVRSVTQVQPGDTLQLYVKDGRICTVVSGTEKRS